MSLEEANTGPQKLAREKGGLCPVVGVERLWMMMMMIYLNCNNIQSPNNIGY